MENLAQAARDGLEDDEQARVIEEVRDIRARFPPRNDYGEPSDSEPNTATRSTFEPAQLGSSDSEDHHPSRFPSFSSNVIELDDEHSYFDPEETGGYEDEDDDGGPAHECSDNSEGADTMSSVLDVDERPDGNAMSALADRAASLELSGATSPPFVLAYLPEPRTEQHPSSSSNPQAEASFPAGSSVTATVPAAILPFGQAPGEAPLRPEIQFNAKPPFVSDGRGRVVWSNSTRGRSRRD
ncbi:hypothetical protein NEOLEDRAFT_63656 [Neolentinus lepideus HHB14362 ss-1]|uniref:Uncharacterized protein n=1 Tax=Neolentinus lepideus HHB14362 ss-1 TaxID=1314782 RepID=A0A165U964_9AGAM|nr:hypothetical protein NEOLEDRAFT_63656 [Neolentinus lepideus HHB14362 ss-1]